MIAACVFWLLLSDIGCKTPTYSVKASADSVGLERVHRACVVGPACHTLTREAVQRAFTQHPPAYFLPGDRARRVSNDHLHGSDVSSLIPPGFKATPVTEKEPDAVTHLAMATRFPTQ